MQNILKPTTVNKITIMLTKIKYPRCATSFRNWCLSNYKYEKIYYEIGEPAAFDVTLRDGLQSLSHDKQVEFKIHP